ncbi:MAG: hypothetical protein F6K62_23960 [Sphaerospermopsis sp. SIO1G2]|nr:hypothetical protein [Sphaerospermopsis sp. SIO1G1]NET73880.1 hypothetical protein [Sphaerospermopsis sp. SIO1G2]
MSLNELEYIEIVDSDIIDDTVEDSNLQGRASSKNQDQGQWLNDQDWLKLEKLIPNYYGNYTIKFNRPIGRVYHTDGSVTDNVIYAVIGRNPDGTIKYAYPIVKPK